MSQYQVLAKNSVFLYIRLILTSLLGLVSMRYVLINLGITNFGLYSVVGSVVVVMNFFSTVLESTTHRFISYEIGRNNGEYVNKIFNISMAIHLLLVVILICLAETVGVWYIRYRLNIDSESVYDALFVFRFSILAAAINVVSVPFHGLVTALEKMKIKAVFEVLRSFLQVVLVLALGFFLGNKLRIYAGMMLALTIVSSSLFVVYCRLFYQQFVTWSFQTDKGKYKEMLSFSGWIMIGAAAHVGKDTGSQLIINSFFGTILNAAFGIANTVNSFVRMFAQSLGQAAVPQIVKSYSGGEHSRTKELVAYVSKYSFYLFYLPSLPLLLEMQTVLNFWLGTVPEYTVAFCRLMLVNGLIDSLQSGIYPAVQASGKIKWFQIIQGSIMLAILPLSYLFFEFGYPPFTIIYVSSIISVCNLFVILYLLKKVIGFDIKYLLINAHYKAITVLGASVPVFFIVNEFESSMMRLVITFFGSVSWLLLVIYRLGLNPNEREFIKQFIVKFFKPNV